MKIRLSLVLLVLSLFALAWGVAAITGHAAGEAQRDEEIARAVIAREKASSEAWQRKDKSFFADFLTDDSTFFNAMSPYLETDPKTSFFPKFDQFVESYKIIDFEMYNPRVQVYGDTAILTYNSGNTVSFGGRVLNYTGKVTSVYVRQGNTWRVAHSHETMNPGAQ